MVPADANGTLFVGSESTTIGSSSSPSASPYSMSVVTVFEATGATGSIEIGFAETVRSGEDKANGCLRSGRAAWNRIGAEEDIYLRFSRCGEREHGGTSDKQKQS